MCSKAIFYKIKDKSQGKFKKYQIFYILKTFKLNSKFS